MKIMQFYYTNIHRLRPAFWSVVGLVVYSICSYVDVFVIGILRQSSLNIFVPAAIIITSFALEKITEQQEQLNELKRELEEMKQKQ